MIIKLKGSLQDPPSPFTTFDRNQLPYARNFSQLSCTLQAFCLLKSNSRHAVQPRHDKMLHALHLTNHVDSTTQESASLQSRKGISSGRLASDSWPRTLCERHSLKAPSSAKSFGSFCGNDVMEVLIAWSVFGLMLAVPAVPPERDLEMCLQP